MLTRLTVAFGAGQTYVADRRWSPKWKFRLTWGTANSEPGEGCTLVYRAFVYSLLALVVGGSCLLEYSGTRLLSSLPISKQNRTAIGALVTCTLALLFFRANMVVTNCFVLVTALVAGLLLSRYIASVRALLTLLIVAAIVDLISAHMGPSRWLVDQA